MSSADYFFPSPVGGVPVNIDLGPSVALALLYACLVPLIAYRAISRRSRTMILAGTMIFGVQR